MSVPSSKAGCRQCLHPAFEDGTSSSKAGCRQCLHPAFEDGTDTGFRNVCQLQFDAGEIPKRIYTTTKTLILLIGK